jgi:hypothetical protein
VPNTTDTKWRANGGYTMVAVVKETPPSAAHYPSRERARSRSVELSHPLSITLDLAAIEGRLMIAPGSRGEAEYTTNQRSGAVREAIHSRRVRARDALASSADTSRHDQLRYNR